MQSSAPFRLPYLSVNISNIAGISGITGIWEYEEELESDIERITNVRMQNQNQIMEDVKKFSSASPNRALSPPNCAICLGPCTNKSVLNSCMHQFCFGCVLKWSKIKAECPLCKQPFTSILHNIKSNNEYEEHIVTSTETVDASYNTDNFLYVPTRSMHQMRHFQFRTTLTVDLSGELEISYLTHSPYNPRRFRRDVSSTSFRKSIYNLNLWSNAPPDITGRYRLTNPEFYRMNPAAINRLAPWLNRELNALLEENTQQVMTLVDVILTHLREHHIKGRFFRNLLTEHFGMKTSHFIHEFYNFMQSPFDMIGYDRHVLYTHRHIEIVSDIDDTSDSDVQVVETEDTVTSTNSLPVQSNEVIEIRSDTDSDVIIISDAENQNATSAVRETVSWEESERRKPRKPILPLKIRLKCKGQSKDGIWTCKRSSPMSPSSSSDSDFSHTSNYSSKKHRRKNKWKKRKSTDSKSSIRLKAYLEDNSDDEPLSCLQSKLKRDAITNHEHSSISARIMYKKRKKSAEIPNIVQSLEQRIDVQSDNFSTNANEHKLEAKLNVDSPKHEFTDLIPGPSNGLTSCTLKRENNNNWYYRPPSFSDSDDD